MNRHFSAELQRLRYWQGQKLKSKDLRDQMSYTALLQAWHNRALHNTYGVRTGLQVLLENDEALVKPGIAYDIHGRSLVLEEDRRQQLPLQIPPQGLYLVLQRKPSGGPDNGFSQLQLHWQDAHRFNPHDGVALARLLPGPALDRFFNLPVARPESEPRCFYGDSLDGNMPWQLWYLTKPQIMEGASEPEIGPENLVLGLEVEVDTSAAGFTQTPCYFAWLRGGLWSSDLPGKLKKVSSEIDHTVQDRIIFGLVRMQFLIIHFGHVAEPTPTGFTYRLWFPRTVQSPRQIRSLSELLAFASPNRLTLNWLGIQMDHDLKENYERTEQNPHD